LDTKYIILIDIYENPSLMKKYFPEFWKSFSLWSIYYDIDTKKLTTYKNLTNLRKHYPYLTFFVNEKYKIVATSIGLNQNKELCTTIPEIIQRNITIMINEKLFTKDEFHPILEEEKFIFRKLFKNFKHISELRGVHILIPDDKIKLKIYKSRTKGFQTVKEKIAKENKPIIYEKVIKIENPNLSERMEDFGDRYYD
jgi:hypothetical protein